MYTLSNQQFKGKVPQIDPNAFVAPSVFLSGDVRIGKYSSIWPGVVARGDVNYISVGECSNVQDLCCLHVADNNPCIIGDYVTIGHSACIHGCEIEDHVLIGMHSTILTGAKSAEALSLQPELWFCRIRSFLRTRSLSVSRQRLSRPLTRWTTSMHRH